jgi:hypothetical protein
MPGEKMGHLPGDAGAAAGVTVHLPAELASRIDAWAGEHDAATRAHAIISLVEIGLGAPDNQGAAAALRDRAATLAGQQIDRMADDTATDAERETRKNRLTDGPTPFREIRRDRPGSDD